MIFETAKFVLKTNKLKRFVLLRSRTSQKALLEVKTNVSFGVLEFRSFGIFGVNCNTANEF